MDGADGKDTDEASCPLCVIQKVLKKNDFIRDVVGRTNCDAVRRRLAFGSRDPHRHGTTDVRVRYWNVCCALFVLEGVVQQIYDRALRPRDVERGGRRMCFVNQGFEGEPSATGLDAAAPNPVLLRGEVLAGTQEAWGGAAGGLEPRVGPTFDAGTLQHLFGEDEAGVECDPKGDPRGPSAAGCFVRRKRRTDGGPRPRSAEPKVRGRGRVARWRLFPSLQACKRVPHLKSSFYYMFPLFQFLFIYLPV